jgi:hypothetical protein
MARVSQIIEAWKREGAIIGELYARRESLLTAIRLRLADPVPEPIRLAVEATDDPAKLGRWFDAALTARTIGEMDKEMKPKP